MTTDAVPLSFAQERLWFFDQFEPGSPVYVLSGQVRLNMRVDRAVLERSLNEIVRRHESLRTTFASVHGRPVQVIAERTELPLPVLDLRRKSGNERAEALHALARDEARRPFDLARGPLLRTTLIVLADDEYVLLLSMHHIVSDGWSIGVFFRELAALYDAFAAGRPSPLPELAVQYADFAIWQRKRLDGDALERHLEFWRAQLAGSPALLALPTDRPRPAMQTFNGAAHAFNVPPEVARKVTALSHREGVTLFMTLLAAFAAVLARYTDQDDIPIGSPIANRTRAELEGLIGFFVNTLVLRVDLAGNPTFRELLQRVREVTLQAYAHQDLPFEKLVNAVQPERALSYNPLFQVMLVLQNTPTTAQVVGNGAESAGTPALHGDNELNETAKFDLTLFVAELGAGFAGGIQYNTDLFDAATIERMARHFNTLLAGIATDPDRRLWDLPLLTAAEKRELVFGWNDTAAPYPHDRCVHELVEERAAHAPDAVAIVTEDEHLTYRELRLRANRLARALRELGVGPEVCVGVCADRCAAAIVALLAILEAGGVYVPLDPTYPTERVAFMLKDAHVAVLLAHERLLALLPRGNARVVVLDEEWLSTTAEPDGDLPRLGGPDNLAYVIYTSGSTGVPKGIALPHRTLVNLLSSAAGAMRGSSRVVQFAPESFDVSVQEVLATLVSGGTLLVMPKEHRRDPRAVLEWMERFGVERWYTPPAVLELVAAALARGELASLALRDVLVAGEALNVTGDIVQMKRRQPNLTLRNQYGPAETHVVSEYVLDDADYRLGPIPIGRPIANTQLYVLDRALSPVPLGVAGELYVGGAALARGYVGRPDLTAERFVPNPYAAQPGARMYRTGDLARYRPDGNLEFLGRTDHQVKVRGIRVEPGEIESALRSHPAVREAVVLGRPDRSGRMNLIAYLLCDGSPAPSVTELRAFLGATLPDFMLPAAFVVLDRLPLSPNGKIDRAKLPDPEAGRPELEQSYVAPSTPIENALAQIWSDVLEIERVGIHDNFFELGGHSLLATQVVSRIRDTFQLDLPLRCIFESPRISSLAVAIVLAELELAAPDAARDVVVEIAKSAQ